MAFSTPFSHRGAKCRQGSSLALLLAAAFVVTLSAPTFSFVGAPSVGATLRGAAQEVSRRGMPAAASGSPTEAPSRFGAAAAMSAGLLVALVIGTSFGGAAAQAKQNVITLDNDPGYDGYDFNTTKFELSLSKRYSEVAPVCEEYDAVVTGGARNEREIIAKRVKCENPEDRAARLAAGKASAPEEQKKAKADAGQK